MRLTTILLIFLIIVLTALISKGQVQDFNKFGRPVTNGALSLYVGGPLSTMPSKVDTIKSYLLVTMDIYECSGDCRITKSVTGYEVIETNGYKLKWFYLGDDKSLLIKILLSGCLNQLVGEKAKNTRGDNGFCF